MTERGMDMEKKYQIFISSTYEDLKEERDTAVKTILTLCHIPIGMEMFNAGDDKQWEVIRRTIDASDYYVLILGFRYGSMTDSGISYTEKEYDYAVKKGIPVIALMKDLNVPSTPAQREKEAEAAAKLEAFREKAARRIVKFWKDKNELAACLATSLTSEIERRPGIGWTRTPAQPPEIQNTCVDWGLQQIFRLRADKNGEADTQLLPQAKELDGIAFGLKTFRSAHTEDIEQLLLRGGRIRLLAMHPDSPFVKQREREENEVEGQIAKSIVDLVEWAKTLKERTGGDISIRYYRSMTLDFYWRLDDVLYVGPYLYGRASQATLTYKYKKGGMGYREYSRYFEDLWNDMSLTEQAL